MSKTTHLSALLACLALVVAAPLSGQTAGGHEGAFARGYPGAAVLVAEVEVTHARLLEALFSSARDGLPEGIEASVLAALGGSRGVERDGGASIAASASMPSLSRAAPRLAHVIDAAHALQREIRDIHAEDRMVNRAAAVDSAIDRYLAGGEGALAAVPKAMEVVNEQPHAGAFRAALPNASSGLWASHWLHLALYDPLMYFAATEDRRGGVDVVVDRFRHKLAGAPDRLPIEMPTPAAISPELTRRYPRAAAIVDNLHMLQRVVADILVEAESGAVAAAIDDAIDLFTDPEYRVVPAYDWMVMSLRHGIYHQGGPAIGTLERNERNVGAHDMHGGAAVFSGMGSGPDGVSVVGETGDEVQPPTADELDPHAGH